MKTQLGRVVLLVKDYDEAYTFYSKNFNCRKIFEATTEEGQRFLHVAFTEDDKTGVWFLKADDSNQNSTVGKQTAGQPTLVIYTDDSRALYTHLKANNVKIIEDLVDTPESTFFHCLDLYGNRLTIVELKGAQKL